LPKLEKAAGNALLDIKRRLSPKLMPLESVSGVGVSGGKLAVYLVREAAEEELKKIRALIDTEAPGTQVQFVTTGEFRPH
jgi:hypothetical protein